MTHVTAQLRFRTWGQTCRRDFVPLARSAWHKLWPQTVFRSDFVTHSTTNNQAIQRTMTNRSDTIRPYQTPCCATTPNTPCKQDTAVSPTGIRILRILPFITETLSFSIEHETLWTLCCTPKQYIPAGHGKTNRNTTIKFDFALQSARARRARNPPPVLRLNQRSRLPGTPNGVG